MIRFIINFFLFGFLFFLIYTYFPEAFLKLYSWANDTFLWAKSLVETHVTSSPDIKPPHQ